MTRLMRSITIVLALLMANLASADIAWRQHDPDRIAKELDRIKDTGSRDVLSAAIQTLGDFRARPDDRAAAREALVASGQEDLIYLLFTTNMVDFRLEDGPANLSPRLLSRTMIYLMENFRGGPTMNALYEPMLMGASASLIQMRIKAEGINIDTIPFLRPENPASRADEMWTTIEFAERLLTAALPHTAPGSEFHQQIQDAVSNLTAFRAKHRPNLTPASATDSVPSLSTTPVTVVRSIKADSTATLTSPPEEEPADGSRWHWGWVVGAVLVSLVTLMILLKRR